MKTTDKYIGLDVPKNTITVAIAEGVRLGEVRQYGKISNDLHSLEKLLPGLGGEKVRLHFVYKAGLTGFVIRRWLLKRGIDSIVVAASKTPQEKGPRQKTDRRDAEQLPRLHRPGEPKAIHVPDEVDEAIRDITRVRSDAVDDLRGPSSASNPSSCATVTASKAKPTGVKPIAVTSGNWFCPSRRKKPCWKNASWPSPMRPTASSASTP